MNRHDTNVRPIVNTAIGGFRVNGFKWFCSCGHESRWFAVRRDAEGDAVEHVRIESNEEAR